MTAPTRLAVFGLAAAIALGGGAALGAVAGPEPAPATTLHADHEESSMPSTTLAPATHPGYDDKPAAEADPHLGATSTEGPTADHGHTDGAAHP